MSGFQHPRLYSLRPMSYAREGPPDGSHTASDDVISVVVPVKDEAESIKQLFSEIEAVLTPEVTDGRDWELIIVDDGSEDGSWGVVEELSALSERVVGIRLRRNFGKSKALSVGLQAARGDLIVTIDGDLQDDPAEIPGMLLALTDSVDLVVGYKEKRADPITKRFPSRVFNAVTSAATGLDLKDQNCGLKVGRRAVFDSVPLYGELHRYIPAIAHAQGFGIAEKSVHHRARLHGESKFGAERYLRGALDLLTVVTITKYQSRPAHLLGGIGVLIGAVGGALLLYLAGVSIFTDQPIGDRPMLALGVLLVVVSVQLISLGLLAELIVALHARGNLRETVIVSRTSRGR